MPASVSIPMVRRRSVAAMAREAAAWIIGTSASAIRNRVRRIASRRKTLGSSYIWRSMSAGDDAVIRARASRKTLAGSVACSTTIDDAASASVEAPVPGARR